MTLRFHAAWTRDDAKFFPAERGVFAERDLIRLVSRILFCRQIGCALLDDTLHHGRVFKAVNIQVMRKVEDLDHLYTRKLDEEVLRVRFVEDLDDMLDIFFGTL